MVGALENVNTDNWDIPKWQELTTFLKDILEEEVDEKYYLNQDQIDKLLFRTEVEIKDIDEPKAFDVYNKKIKQDRICPRLTLPHHNNLILIKNATKQWYLEAKAWDWIILDNPNSKTKRWRVKHWISWTLTCAWSDWVITKDLWIRKFTPWECERLQGFDGNWTKWVSDNQRYKQMWNAISVPVAKSIFDNLFKEA